MKVFLCIRKVYVLAAGNYWQSYWMIFDVATQFWTFSPNDLEGLEINCCPGRILTIRNIHYYFNNDIVGSSPSIDPIVKAALLSPIYRILDNGTSIDLESEIPFAKEYWAEKAENPNGEVKDLTIAQAPFYQRFYED